MSEQEELLVENVKSSQPSNLEVSSTISDGTIESTSSTSNISTLSSPPTSQQPGAKIREADSTRPSGLPKPSGIKPPSKIGRLCSNTAPKPAVPLSPRTDGSSTDNLRKYSDDYTRKHLSDLVEADEDGEVTSSFTFDKSTRLHRKASTSSTYSVTSMDSLWEKHPRRLSEAGLRRSSDHSVVLTEDTDSFIIGDRVWVGGSKPGQIAYIGETQFAPGEWAGIVLDDPIGKNDGSVAGVRYFQCAEKRGVFSRLTRLTRVPLITPHLQDASPCSDAGSVFDRPPSGAARRRALSPNGSVRSAFSSKMNASVATSNSSGELRLGDRVIVSSSRGSKAGTLRYVGITDFATGIWAGVELDDPLGKNDGSVEGKRYFECAPRFGLFAPISKVSRSPSNRKPGACAIHSNGRSTTPIRRSNSRESLTSLGTSIASSARTASRTGPGVRLGVTSLSGAQRLGGPRATSTPVSAKNALQELLREKQQHLERLMKERELERAEVARVQMQVNRTEDILAHVRSEAAQITNENEKLKSELGKITKLLEDERQKVEDLTFRTEEENINKEDYNKYKDAMEAEKAASDKRIRDLETELALQAARTDAAADTLKAFEKQKQAEFNIINQQHKEELTAAQTLSSELQKLLDEAYALLQEKETEKDSLGKSLNEELTRMRIESEKALNDAKSKLTIMQTEFETQLAMMTSKLQLTESKLESERQNLELLSKDNSQTILNLNTKLSHLQATVDDKTYELNKALSSAKEHDLTLTKEITKLKMELSAKVLDIEQLTETFKKQENSYNNLQNEIHRLKEEYATKINEYENLLTEVSNQSKKNVTEINELEAILSNKVNELDSLNSKFTETEKQFDEYKEKINERDKEIIKLKNDIELANADFNIKHSLIADEHKKEIDNRNLKIEELQRELKNYEHTLESNRAEVELLNSKVCANVDEIKLLIEQNGQLKQTNEELALINLELKQKVSAVESECIGLKRDLDNAVQRCEDFQKAKEKVENEYLNLTGQNVDSNEQFNKLSHVLRETEKELQDSKEKNRETISNYKQIEDELKQKIFNIQEEFSQEREKLIKINNEHCNNIALAESKFKDYETRLFTVENDLKDKESRNAHLNDKNISLEKSIKVLAEKEVDLNSEIDLLRNQVEDNSNKYKQEILNIKSIHGSTEEKLLEKINELTDKQNDLNKKLEEARKQEDHLRISIDEFNVKMKEDKTYYENLISQKESELALLKSNNTSDKSEITRLENTLLEKENSIKELTLKLGMLEVDLKSNVDIISGKESQIESINKEFTNILDHKNMLEDTLNNVVSEKNALQQKYNAILASSNVGESMLKEEREQLEVLKRDMSKITQEKTALESQLTQMQDQFVKLQNDYIESCKKIDDLNETKVKLHNTLEERENCTKTQTDSYNTALSKTTLLEEELENLKTKFTQKVTALNEKDAELSNLHKLLENRNKESAESIGHLQNELETLNKNYKNELLLLNNQIKNLVDTSTEQHKQSETLNQCRNKITELENLLTKSYADIKNLTNINQSQKGSYEDLNRQLQSQYDEYKKESKKSKHDLKTKISEYVNELKDSKDKINNEITKQNELRTKLTESENSILELNNKLELLFLQQNNSIEDKSLENVTVELQALRKINLETVANNENIISSLRTDVENKMNDLKKKDILIVKLQEDLKNQIVKAEILEREKLLLEKGKSVIATKNDSKEDEAHKFDKDAVDGQVSFLNSVIVDMQRKNEQLMARVQALESGNISPEPIVYNGRKLRATAPRLFCDICDVFDAHDTEDCPRQADTSEDPPPQPATTRKAPPPQRPYCDICEVFGHATENCDEEETF